MENFWNNRKQVQLWLFCCTVYTGTEANNLDYYRKMMETFIFLLLFLPGRINAFPQGNSWCTAKVILVLPVKNYQSKLLWELTGDGKPEEKRYIQNISERKEILTKMKDTLKKKIKWFSRWCKMESEKLFNRQNLHC